MSLRLIMRTQEPTTLAGNLRLHILLIGWVHDLQAKFNPFQSPRCPWIMCPPVKSYGNPDRSNYEASFSLLAAETQRIIVFPSNLRVAETWRILEIPQPRKRCGYTCLSNAFPRSRGCGNATDAHVSRNGYLNFRFRKFEFPLRIRHKNGSGNTPFHPVLLFFSIGFYSGISLVM